MIVSFQIVDKELLEMFMPESFFNPRWEIYIKEPIYGMIGLCQSHLHLHLCQFLQVHACKGQPGFHLHPCLPIHLCVTEPVALFGCPEDPLYRLFSQSTQLFHPYALADILTYLHIWFSDMSCYRFNMILTLRTLSKVRAASTDFATTLILPITVPVGGTVLQYLMIRT